MESKNEKNHIRVGFNSRVGNVIRYVNALISEDKPKTIVFCAIGGAIGSLVNAVEAIKIVNPGFYQINKISSVAHKSVDSSSNKEVIEKLSPKLDITLTLDRPSDTSAEGFQEKLNEEERLTLFNKYNEKLNRNNNRREGNENQKDNYRSDNRNNQRGYNRDNRGRGGFTRGGNRGRGGFRENNNYNNNNNYRRDQYQEGEQGGYNKPMQMKSRGNRGGYNNYRDENRGGYNNYRDENRQGYNNRDESRQGYNNRDENRQGYNNNRGNSNNRGDNRRGFNDNRGGYNSNRGGYNSNRGSRGGFNNNRRGSFNDSRY